ncbi:MAG: class I SAM-dependent methyltransferase [Solobacterium sp.]|nr:class I SAM-dependent methyltransferase [Solobacterium sp.]
MENLTAKVSCFARAYHYKNNTTHIFADDLAETILKEEYDQIAENMKHGIPFFLKDFQGTKEEGLRKIVNQQLSPSVLGRSAFCERMLQKELERGCSQYLIFASGYDTYALRNRNRSIQVYELDLETVLTDKINRINNAGLFSNAIYVPCDLTNEDWKEKLQKKGFKPDKHSYASLSGISYYLQKTEWKKLIQALAFMMSEGSAICFDYPSVDESHETKVNQKLADAAGEKMKALYACEEMEELLSECGFMTEYHLDAKGMTDQYFSAYNRNRPEDPILAPEGVCYILARKRPQ